MIKGIDVSRYQKEIDWDKVKADGIQFAMIKAVSTNSKYGGIYIDPYFERNYAECKRLNIPCGAYYYTYAQSKEYADKELAKFKEAITGKQFEYPLSVDVEDNRLKPLSANALTDLVIYALEEIESWKCYANIYTYTHYKNTELNMDRLKVYDLWIAQWGNEPKIPHGMWQYANNGSVKGINGNVDMDYSYKDYPTIIKKAKLNGFSNDVPIKPTEKFFPAKGYFCTGDKHKNIAKIAEFMYYKFPAYTDKRALGDLYGQYIKQAIREFQNRVPKEVLGEKLVVDGCVGQKTLKALKHYGFKEN